MIASPTARGIRGIRLGLFLVPFSVLVRQLGFGIGSHDARVHALLHTLRNVAWGFDAELWRRWIVRIAYGGIVNDQSLHEKWGPAPLSPSLGEAGASQHVVLYSVYFKSGDSPVTL